jgi:hypothetical protein
MFITHNKQTLKVLTASEKEEENIPDGFVSVEIPGAITDGPANPSLCKFIDGALVLDASVDLERQAALARAERDARIANHIDTINAVRWAALTEEQRAALLAYRQALLDIPSQEGFPSHIEWPEAPA